MPFRPITPEQAMCADPARCAPPIQTDDARDVGVGAAHGRVLPLVGNTRPYMLDVTVVGTDTRIYADRATDVLSLLIGAEYADLADKIESAQIVDRVLPAPPRPLGDYLPTELAAMAVPEIVADPTTAEPQARQQVIEWLYDMARLRWAHASEIRAELQQAVNAAIDTETWQALSDAEREELTASADPTRGHPVGIPRQAPHAVPTGDGSAEFGVHVEAVWSASARLVLNTGDYAPWSEAPWVIAIREHLDSEGRTVEYPTRENTIELVVDTEEEYLQSLVDAGVLTLEERLPTQVDPMFAGMTESPIVNPHLRVSDDADAS